MSSLHQAMVNILNFAMAFYDLKDNYISIDKNLIRSFIKECKFNTPKTNSSIRNVELDDYVLNNLKKLKEYYKTFIGFSDDWFIFGGLVPLSTTTIERKKELLL